MHSPTLANDFSFRLTLAFATFQPISFSLRSMPPLQIPYSHTLADSFSLFALFSTLASFVFNNLRTLFAKHPGVGVALVLPFTSHQPRITNHVSRSPLFPWSYKLFFPQSLRSGCLRMNRLTTFKMNTCKSVSKQRTLSTCRMNTYAKTGGGGHTPFRYRPGTSLTNQTGSIPDTARTLAIACKTSACHGKRAVLWKKNFDLSLSTSVRNAP